MSFGVVGGIVVGLAGSAISANASRHAAQDQVKGGDRAIEEDRRQYDQTREDFAPYRETGSQALGAIARGLGLGGYSPPGTTAPLSFEEWSAANPGQAQQLSPAAATILGRVSGHPAADPRAAYESYVAGFKPTQTTGAGDNGVSIGDFNRDFTLADFQKDPGYEFRRSEGMRALEGSAAARTGVQNGRTLRELERYGEDYATGEFSNAYNRFNNDRTTRFNRLASIAGVGQTATGSTAAAGENASNNISDTIIGQANARASGRVGQANAVNNGIQTLGNFYLQNRYGGTGSSPKTPPVYNTGDGGWYG